MSTAAAAMGAVAAAAAGFLDEYRTRREEHDKRYDQCKNNVTQTHDKCLFLKSVVCVNAHAAQAVGGVSLGRLAYK